MERVAEHLLVMRGAGADVYCVHRWVVENAAVVRFDAPDAEIFSQFARAFYVHACYGADIDESQPAQCFQVYAAHETGAENCCPDALLHLPALCQRVWPNQHL